jgi:hypothetical protein
MQMIRCDLCYHSKEKRTTDVTVRSQLVPNGIVSNSSVMFNVDEVNMRHCLSQ